MKLTSMISPVSVRRFLTIAAVVAALPLSHAQTISLNLNGNNRHEPAGH